MSHEDKNIAVSDLFLDESNPRFPEVSSQRGAIDAMLEEQGEKIANLAAHIYANGLNPSDRLIVFTCKSRLKIGTAK